MGTVVSLSKTENNQLRILVKRALASGDYTSYNELGVKTGIGSTTLYPFMRGVSGLSRPTAEALRPHLERYSRTRAERLQDPKGASIVITRPTLIARANGRTNRKSNGHLNGHVAEPESKVKLTRDVVNKLFNLREATTDASVRARIDKVTENWALDGLHILATAAASN